VSGAGEPACPAPAAIEPAAPSAAWDAVRPSPVVGATSAGDDGSVVTATEGSSGDDGARPASGGPIEGTRAAARSGPERRSGGLSARGGEPGGGGKRPPARAYRGAFEAEGDARILMEVVSPSEFRCVDANDGAARFLGVPREELIGATPDSRLAPDVAARAKDLLARALRGTAQADSRRVGADGAVRDYAVLARPILDGRGRVRWIETVVQDITESLRVRRERDDARSLLASVFSAARAGIVVADESGRIIEVNDALLRTARAERGTVIGQHFRCLVPPSDHARAEALFPRLAAGEVSGIGEWRLRRHDGGDDVPIVASGSVITRSDGSRCVVATVTDITEQKRLEDALRTAGEAAARANLAKTSFLANVSHELRTPLNAILGFAEMLRAEMFGPLGSARYVEYADDIHTSAQHLLSLVNDLLDLSRIEAGALDLDEDRVDPRQILGAARRMLADTAGRRDIGLEVSASSDLPMCRGDERMLRQVMINLVGNALKFTDGGGRVSVGAAPLADNALAFVIRDTGPGIPVDRHGEALAPYGRIGPSETSTGSGLGLPLARAMIERHGGHMLLHSDTGAGTAVVVLLPAERSVGRPAEDSAAAVPADPIRHLPGIAIHSAAVDDGSGDDDSGDDDSGDEDSGDEDSGDGTAGGGTASGGAASGGAAGPDPSRLAALTGLPDGVLRVDAGCRILGTGPEAGRRLADLAPGLEHTPLPDAVRRLGAAAATASRPVDLADRDTPPERLFDVTTGMPGKGDRHIVHLRGVPRREEVLVFVKRLPGRG